MADERAAGAIYDIGYQHYEGARLGRANAVRTLIAYSFRAAFGAGRGSKAQQMPVVVVVVLFGVAILEIAISAATGAARLQGLPPGMMYAQHFQFTALFVALFVAAQAPELIVTDRQSGVLPLYLSRSLRSTDYALAKFVAFVAAILVVTLGPELVLFLGKVMESDAPWQQFQGDWKTLGPIVGGALLVSCYMASVGLGLAAYTARRAYASAAVIAFFVLMPAIAGVTTSLLHDDARRYAPLGSPFAVLGGFGNWLFDVQARRFVVAARAGRRAFVPPPDPLSGRYYLAVILITCAIGISVFMWRYRKAEE